MPEAPRITILTVVRNRVHTIRQALDSVLGQSYPNIEYVVVDGQSTDGTLKILEEYRSRIQVLVSERDHGLYDAINKGNTLATGDVVGLLHSDDFYENRDVVSRVAETFQKTGVDAVYGDLLYVRADNPATIVRRWISAPYRPRAFYSGWHPPHTTLFVRKAAIAHWGAYDLQYRIAADYEFMLRLFEVGKITSAYLPETFLRMRLGGESNRSLMNILRANWECYRAFLNNDLRVSPLIMLRKPLSKSIQWYKANRKR
ncbi:MAG: glycosyltransferase [Spirochaetes bacterium]|nr:glycosyltransferase [Spirochaetota bacterium]